MQYIILAKSKDFTSGIEHFLSDDSPYGSKVTVTNKPKRFSSKLQAMKIIALGKLDFVGTGIEFEMKEVP
jgi:hypothetical protein